ncbi:MAG: tetraacyldisaccharide 4'-kinase [Mariprofundales bacterium]
MCLEKMWWRQQSPPFFLRMLSHIYGLAMRYDQKQRRLRQVTPPLPLISVGNISVGGSSKTPFVIWLAHALQAHNFSPIILCRGDGGKSNAPQRVQKHHKATEIGDEARLLADECGSIPVWVGRDRVLATTQARLEQPEADVFILDDGLQYQQLQRTCEIILFAGAGNACLLPAGPLRQPLATLQTADVLVQVQKNLGLTNAWHWHTVATKPVLIAGKSHIKSLKEEMLKMQAGVLAVSSIAKPWRFHDDLEQLGINIIKKRVFSDHHAYGANDVQSLLALGLPIITTSKDAVKLATLWSKDADSVALWLLPLQAKAQDGLLEDIIQHILAPINNS